MVSSVPSDSVQTTCRMEEASPPSPATSRYVPLSTGVYFVQRNQGEPEAEDSVSPPEVSAAEDSASTCTAGLDRADGKGTVGIDDQAGIVRSVIGALIPCLPCHESRETSSSYVACLVFLEKVSPAKELPVPTFMAGRHPAWKVRTAL